MVTPIALAANFLQIDNYCAHLTPDAHAICSALAHTSTQLLKEFLMNGKYSFGMTSKIFPIRLVFLVHARARSRGTAAGATFALFIREEGLLSMRIEIIKFCV